MKILMISDVYFPRVNGVSTSIATFRRSLAQLGHETWLIAPDYGTATDDEHNIIRIPSRYLFVDPEDRMLKADAIFSMRETLAQQGFDLMHVQTPFVAHYVGVRLAQQLGIPVVETYHTYFEQYLYHYVRFLPRSLMKAAARLFSRRQCNRVDAVVVPSHAMRDALADYGVNVPMEIIPTGLNLSELQRGSRERFCDSRGIDQDRAILVHVGRVAHEKNIGFLLRVTAEVCKYEPDLLLLIAGEGPARKDLEASARRLGIEGNVRFVNYLPRGTALWDCFCAGDVFVFASATETQGLVLLEAMALGVPLVSTSVMGTRDVVGPGKGVLVADEALEDFSGKVLQLLRDPKLRQRLSAQGRLYAQEWSAESMARRMVGFYGSVVGREGEPVVA